MYLKCGTCKIRMIIDYNHNQFLTIQLFCNNSACTAPQRVLMNFRERDEIQHLEVNI